MPIGRDASRPGPPLLPRIGDALRGGQDHEFTAAHEDMRRHGYFPDPAYYELMLAAPSFPNVRLAVTTQYEAWSALAPHPPPIAVCSQQRFPGSGA